MLQTWFRRLRPGGASPERRGVTRRVFLGSTAAFVVGISLMGGAEPAIAAGEPEPDLFVRIEPDGRVILVCHRSEMGQQIWTAVAQLINEELDAEWDRIEIQQAEGHPRYGDQNTDGSRSIRYNFDRLRLAGAAMREMLIAAAAARWGVSPGECTAASGEVVHGPSSERLGYGELAAEAARLDVPALEVDDLRPRSQWRHVGKPDRSLTTPLVIRGRGTYGQDLFVEGMKVAVIARPPVLGARIANARTEGALEVPGVERVVELPFAEPPYGFSPLGGVAVIATHTWAAIQGREALELEWTAGDHADYDSEAYRDALLAAVAEPGDQRMARGDVDTALAGAATRVSADYYVPHAAHCAMEPPAALAEWRDGKVEVWGCIQTPQSARRTVAAACSVDEDDVTCTPTWLGGGFGRKSKPDFFAEAALLAREVGAPVKVVWTREDDLRHAYYHTVSAQRLEAGLDANGRCVALLHRTTFPPIRSTFVDGADEPGDGELRMGAADTPWAVPNARLETAKATAHLRIGWLRAVCNIQHAFAVQSFAAEMAHAAGRDPKDYLLELIGPPREVDPNDWGFAYDNYGSPLDSYPIDTGRMARVVERVAELARWGRALPDGHGLGIAVHRSFVTYVATVVEVAVDAEGRLTIPGAWSVMDAGTVVNPNHCEHQMEGGTLYGLSNALFGEITARAGEVEQRNFPGFRVMRMNEAPREMAVEIIESDAPPGGVGEPAAPPAAPALANAIFAATGTRIRHLPIFDRSRRDQLPTGGDR